MFFGEIAAPLVESLNHSFSVGELSTSQKQVVIALIEKKGRDKKLVKKLETYLSYECRHKDCI